MTFAIHHSTHSATFSERTFFFILSRTRKNTLVLRSAKKKYNKQEMNKAASKNTPTNSKANKFGSRNTTTKLKQQEILNKFTHETSDIMSLSSSVIIDTECRYSNKIKINDKNSIENTRKAVKIALLWKEREHMIYKRCQD